MEASKVEDHEGEHFRTTTTFQKLKAQCVKTISLDKNLIKEATNALKQHAKVSAASKKDDLLEDDNDFIYIEVILAEVPTKHAVRPIQIPLPNAIYSEEYLSRACIFVKDEQRVFKDLIADKDVPCLAKVVGLTKLRKNFARYEERRTLLNEHDLFFCDSRIYAMLPKLLGKFFYQRKKFPYPLKFGDYTDADEMINNALKSTYLNMGNGPAYTLKASRVTMSTKDSVKNIIRSIYEMLPFILRSGVSPDKVQQILIKTSDSISLPIYNHLSEMEIDAFKKAPAE